MGGTIRPSVRVAGQMKILFSFIIFMIGCDDLPYELWIDDACTLEDQIIIRDSIDTVNQWVKSEIGYELIAVGGTGPVDHQIAMEHSDPNYGRDWIVCFYKDPIGMPEGNADLTITDGEIFLFFSQILSNRQLKIITMHSLLHHVGLGHVSDGDDRPAVMHSHIDSAVFTEADRELLCMEYECKK